MNQLQKINKGNLSEQVYGTIRSSLMDGRYEPGERLTIASLAEQLGVSITPVREAIFRLADRARAGDEGGNLDPGEKPDALGIA